MFFISDVLVREAVQEVPQNRFAVRVANRAPPPFFAGLGAGEKRRRCSVGGSNSEAILRDLLSRRQN